MIFLTSKDEEIDELFGLKMGADDYIRKAIPAAALLIERVKAVSCGAPSLGTRPRWSTTNPKSLERGKLKMDSEAPHLRVGRTAR